MRSRSDDGEAMTRGRLGGCAAQSDQLVTRRAATHVRARSHLDLRLEHLAVERCPNACVAIFEEIVRGAHGRLQRAALAHEILFLDAELKRGILQEGPLPELGGAKFHGFAPGNTLSGRSITDDAANAAHATPFDLLKDPRYNPTHITFRRRKRSNTVSQQRVVKRRFFRDPTKRGS